MNIRRMLFDGLRDKRVHQSNNWRLVVDVKQVDRFFEILRKRIQIFFRQVLHGRRCVGSSAVVDLVDGCDNLVTGRQHEFDRCVQQSAEVIQGTDREWVGARNHNGPVFPLLER